MELDFTFGLQQAWVFPDINILRVAYVKNACNTIKCLKMETF
jgi:hypothetical protein